MDSQERGISVDENDIFLKMEVDLDFLQGSLQNNIILGTLKFGHR